MAQYSCKDLCNQITFYPDAIDSCCSGFSSPRFYTFDNNCIDYDRLLSRKNNLVNDFKNGKILPTCQNCHNLQNYDENIQYNKFTKILVNHFTRCNCSCIYCVRDVALTNEQKQSAPRYELLPIIKEMYRRNLISTDKLDVDFQGGDIGCLKEFKSLVSLFCKNSISNFHFFTNNIVYYDVIQHLFDENRAELIISLDCGCRETFKKIKRVDKFDVVVNNIEKYVKKSKFPNILLKYILLENVNDNKNEVKKFINLVKSLKLNNICLDLDYNKYMELVPGQKTRCEVPKQYYELVQYFKDETKLTGLCVSVSDYSQNILNKGYFQ